MKNSDSASDCLKTYLPFWRARGFSIIDINIISHFLFANNAMMDLIKFNIECIEKEDPVSWYYFSKALQFIEPNFKNKIYEAIKNYILEQKKLDEFSNSELFEILFPDEREVKFHQLQRKVQMHDRHRQTILDQIRVFNQSRNYSIEKQTIQKFIKHFPNDKLGQELKARFELEELKRFFERYQTEKRQKELPTFDSFTPEEKSLLENIFVKAQNADSNQVEGFIYFFIFIEDFDHALKLIPQLTFNESNTWLHLELLLLNRKYAEALSLIQKIDQSTSNDPSNFAAKVYSVALCFWGLGEQEKAIELMNAIVEINPNYRMASTLIKEWKSEL